MDSGLAQDVSPDFGKKDRAHARRGGFRSYGCAWLRRVQQRRNGRTPACGNEAGRDRAPSPGGGAAESSESHRDRIAAGNRRNRAWADKRVGDHRAPAAGIRHRVRRLRASFINSDAAKHAGAPLKKYGALEHQMEREGEALAEVRADFPRLVRLSDASIDLSTQGKTAEADSLFEAEAEGLFARLSARLFTLSSLQIEQSEISIREAESVLATKRKIGLALLAVLLLGGSFK